MTASSRINSHTDLNRIDETRGNITVEEGDLLVNEKNIDRQTHAHHSNLKISAYLDYQHKLAQEVTKVMQNKNVFGKKDSETLVLEKHDCEDTFWFFDW